MNKCAMVTGGSRNIGQGIAVVLAEHGYDVAITYATRIEGALETKRQIEALGRRCFIYEAHLENEDDPARVIKAAHDDLGRLDVMVCNAGQDRRHSILTVTADEMDFLFENTMRNYFLCTGAAARHMVKDGIEGSIILITSVRGECAHPDDFLYGAMKAGMKRAVESMALELSQYNIRVNCMAPGAVWPPRADGKIPTSPFIQDSIPLHRVGTPRDIGESVAFLAGEQSSYITGISLRADGGLMLPGMMEKQEASVWINKDWTERNKARAIEILEEEE